MPVSSWTELPSQKEQSVNREAGVGGGRWGEEEARHDERKERRRKKREEEAEEKGGKEAGGGGVGPAPPGFFLGWTSPGPPRERRPRLVAGLTGTPEYACPAPCSAAQRREEAPGSRLARPRLARSFSSRARARAHIHTLALRACAVGGAAPGRLLPPPRVGSASAGRRAVSERGASQRASEPERARESASAPSSEQRSAGPALPGHRRHHRTSAPPPRPPPPPTPALPGCCSPAEARGGWGGPWLTFTRPTTPRRLRTWPTASPAKGR